MKITLTGELFMGGFFNIDGPFYRFGTLLADIMIVGILWLVFCIPIVTAGASTTALFYVMLRRISDHEHYIVRDFWKSFKNNFKVATLAWLVLLVVGIILAINIYNAPLLGEMRNWVMPFQIVFALEMLFMIIYIFPLISRFEMKFTGYFKMAFFMANRHFPTTLLCIVLLFAVALVTEISYYIFAVIAGGVYAFLASFLLIRIFKKYRPDMDADIPKEEALKPLNFDEEEAEDKQ